MALNMILYGHLNEDNGHIYESLDDFKSPPI